MNKKDKFPIIKREILLEVLNQKGLKQKDLAEILYITESTFTRKLKNSIGRTGKPVHFTEIEVDTIARFLDVAPETLEGKTESWGVFNYSLHESQKGITWSDVINDYLIVKFKGSNYLTKKEKEELYLQFDRIGRSYLEEIEDKKQKGGK